MGVLGQGTVVVDGQRTTAPPAAAFNPAVFGQQTTGVPNVSPIVPPFASATGAGSAGVSGYASVNGYGTAENNGSVAAVAAANPFSLKVSPVWWAIGALVGGVLVLQAVSWHETVDAAVGRVHAGEHAGSEK